MNTENMRNLANFLDSLQDSNFTFTFDLEIGWDKPNLYFGCGTVCCIAGAVQALRLSAASATTKSEVVNRAQRWLGLRVHEANKLFTPDNESLEYNGYDYNVITPRIVAYVLRDSVLHNDINWQRALESYNTKLAKGNVAS